MLPAGQASQQMPEVGRASRQDNFVSAERAASRVVDAVVEVGIAVGLVSGGVVRAGHDRDVDEVLSVPDVRKARGERKVVVVPVEQERLVVVEVLGRPGHPRLRRHSKRSARIEFRWKKFRTSKDIELLLSIMVLQNVRIT